MSLSPSFESLQRVFLMETSGNGWLPFSLFLLPAFALPAFFLHPDGFTWVFLRSIRDSIIGVFTTIGQVRSRFIFPLPPKFADHACTGR